MRKKKVPELEYLFPQGENFILLTEKSIENLSSDNILRIAINTYMGFYRQLKIDALNLKPSIFRGEEVVLCLQSSLEKLDNMFPGLIQSVRKNSPEFVFRC